jgi:hypothetical protein
MNAAVASANPAAREKDATAATTLEAEISPIAALLVVDNDI